LEIVHKLDLDEVRALSSPGLIAQGVDADKSLRVGDLQPAKAPLPAADDRKTKLLGHLRLEPSTSLQASRRLVRDRGGRIIATKRPSAVILAVGPVEIVVCVRQVICRVSKLPTLSAAVRLVSQQH